MKKVRSVFYDLYSPSEALVMEMKADLLIQILTTVKDRKLSQKDLQRLLDVPQPRVSELLNEKITSMSIEKLVGYLQKLGVTTSLSFKKKRAS